MIVLFFGNKWATGAFVRSWPYPLHVIDASAVFDDLKRSIRDLAAVDSVLRSAGARTIVLDGLSSRGFREEWGPGYWRYFEWLFASLGDEQHVVVCADSSRLPAEAGGETAPDAPAPLLDACDVVVRLVAKDDRKSGARAVVLKHRIHESIVGRELDRVTASTILGGSGVCVLCWGENHDAMIEFAKTWPTPIYSFDLSACHRVEGGMVPDLVEMMQSNMKAVTFGAAKTVVLDGICSPDGTWGPVEEEFVTAMLDALDPGVHVVAFAGAREGVHATPDGMDYRYVPDAPFALLRRRDVSLLFPDNPRMNRAIITKNDLCEGSVGTRCYDLTADEILRMVGGH